MKLQWKVRAFKDYLWRYATALTVIQFEKAMIGFKIFSELANV